MLLDTYRRKPSSMATRRKVSDRAGRDDQRVRGRREHRARVAAVAGGGDDGHARGHRGVVGRVEELRLAVPGMYGAPKDSEMTSACSTATALSMPETTWASVWTSGSKAVSDRSTSEAPGASPLM